MADSNEKRFPSFLGIGAARAGTTWLHANLKKHPQLWLPPIKELHYFDIQRPGAQGYCTVPDVHCWRMSWLWYYRHAKTLCRRLARFRTRPGFALRYLLGRRSDRWYAKLFRTDRISGEITPAYMLLPRAVVEDVHRLNPDMKIIFLLRNPVSRAWSNVRLKLDKRKLKLQANDDTIVELMDAPGSVLRSRYVQAIENWRGVFGAKQVFIGFFDELVSAPRDLLRSVLEFLGVDAGDQYVPETAAKEVNASKKLDLPEHLLPQLYGTYIDELRELEKLVGGPVGKWLAKAEEAVAKKGVEAPPEALVVNAAPT